MKSTSDMSGAGADILNEIANRRRAKQKHKYKSTKRTTTREWVDALSVEDQDLFFDNLASFKTNELWDWIISILPLSHAKRILREMKAEQLDE